MAAGPVQERLLLQDRDRLGIGAFVPRYSPNIDSYKCNKQAAVCTCCQMPFPERRLSFRCRFHNSISKPISCCVCLAVVCASSQSSWEFGVTMYVAVSRSKDADPGGRNQERDLPSSTRPFRIAL